SKWRGGLCEKQTEARKRTIQTAQAFRNQPRSGERMQPRAQALGESSSQISPERAKETVRRTSRGPCSRPTSSMQLSKLVPNKMGPPGWEREKDIRDCKLYSVTFP